MLKLTAKDFHANLFLWTPLTKATILFIYLFIHSFSLMFWVKNWGIEKTASSLVCHTDFPYCVFCYFCLQKRKKENIYVSLFWNPVPRLFLLPRLFFPSLFSGPVESLLPVCGSNNMEAHWARVAGWRHCLVCQKSRWQVFKAPQSWGLSLLLLCEAILRLIVLSFPFIFLLSAQEKPRKRKRPTQPWVLIWIQCS